MPYAASHSQVADTRQALKDVCGAVSAQLNGSRPDLSFLFISRDHSLGSEQFAERAIELTGSRIATTEIVRDSGLSDQGVGDFEQLARDYQVE